MYLFNKLDPFTFILSFAIGFFLVYIFGPRPTILYEYPTPNNIDKVVYEDDLHHCYRYNSKKIKCPIDKKQINQIPIQQNV
jgi:hypothetical protein